MATKKAPNKFATDELRGWKAIGAYLRIPPSSAQRWARDGMPVRREGRITIAEPNQLREWLGREAHMSGPAQILTDNADITDALKKSIAVMRRDRKTG